MKKYNLCLAVASALLLASCGDGQAESSSSAAPLPDGSVCMINDFESDADLALMRFPAPVHEARGKFELSNEHVTSGSKSVKFSNIYNSSFEMQHFFSHCATDNFDVGNIKSIEMDIYNDSQWDTTGQITIYNHVGMDILIQGQFDLPKQQLTHVSFPLSKIALEYNADSIISSSLTLYTPNTNYDLYRGYTFYLDNWKAVMGGEYTDEDKLYQSKVDEVRDLIFALPEKELISLSDESKFEDIANKYAALPDLYRRIVPNYVAFKEKLSAFAEMKLVSDTPDPSRNFYMALNEPYGSTQLTPTKATSAEVYFDNSVKLAEGDKGSTKILFNGTVHSQFNFHSPISAAGYDYIHFRVKNETGRYVRIWFDYSNMFYFDIKAGQTADYTMSAGLFGRQEFWTIDQVEEGTGAVFAASGALYFGEIYLTGRSLADRKQDLLYAFSHLPRASEIKADDSILPYLSIVKAAREQYDNAVAELRNLISNADLNNLVACEYAISQSGYGLAYNAAKAGLNRYFYGENVAPVYNVKDDTYGFVDVAELDNPINGGGVPEQALGFADDVYGGYAGYKIAVYNPTSSPVNVIVRNTNWNWEIYDPLYTREVLQPKTWTLIGIKADLLNISDDGKVCLFLSNPEGVSLHGTWLFSSLFGLPYAI